jgi:hypothetical protein
METPPPTISSSQIETPPVPQVRKPWIAIGITGIATIALFSFVTLNTLNNGNDNSKTSLPNRVSDFAGVEPDKELPDIANVYGTVIEIDGTTMRAIILLGTPSYIREAFGDNYKMADGQAPSISVLLTSFTLVPKHGNSISPITVADAIVSDPSIIDELKGRYVRILTEKSVGQRKEQFTALQFWYAAIQ